MIPSVINQSFVTIVSATCLSVVRDHLANRPQISLRVRLEREAFRDWRPKARVSRSNWGRLSSRVAMLLSLTLPVSACEAERFQPQRPIADPLRIDNVTIVDPLDGSKRAAMSIVIDRGRIVDVLPTRDVRQGSSIATVEGANRFAVPGYNNMHSHALVAPRPELLLATMLAEGVTGFRQMSGTPKLLKARDEGRLVLGPTTPALLAMPGDLVFPFNAGSAKEARAEVNRQRRQHADFIKLILLSRAAFFAAIDEANRLGLPTAGHLPPDVSPLEAAKAGFDSLEHFGTGNPFWLACSSRQAELARVQSDQPGVPWWIMRIPLVGGLMMTKVEQQLINPTMSDTPATVALRQRALDSFDTGRCQALARSFKANNLWQTPTLVRLRTQELADLPEYRADLSLLNMSADTKKTWQESSAKFHALPATMRATFRATYQRRLMVVAQWQAEGVSMMAGTDGKGDVPGQALQQEFAELAKAGLTPLKILQMTTVEPARFLGRSSTMGRIASGMAADLVLLSADPLARVDNLGKVSAVVRAGRYIPRSALDRAVLELRKGP